MREDTVAPPAGVPAIIDAPCGEKARWDYDSGCGYRCMSCFAVLGSVGMPRQCSELNQQVRES